MRRIFHFNYECDEYRCIENDMILCAYAVEDLFPLHRHTKILEITLAEQRFPGSVKAKLVSGYDIKILNQTIFLMQCTYHVLQVLYGERPFYVRVRRTA